MFASSQNECVARLPQRPPYKELEALLRGVAWSNSAKVGWAGLAQVGAAWVRGWVGAGAAVAAPQQPMGRLRPPLPSVLLPHLSHPFAPCRVRPAQPIGERLAWEAQFVRRSLEAVPQSQALKDDGNP